MDYEIFESYAELQAAADYNEAARIYNVVALGNGENPDDDDLVLPAFGCPRCHERRPDRLLVDDDDNVLCASCGMAYSLKPRVCHCGQPLDDGACECEACAAEWNEFLTEAADVRGNLYSF